LPNTSDLERALVQLFTELRQTWLSPPSDVGHVTDERVTRELSLPIDSVTRLCYFSVPVNLLPFYREIAFPLADDVGLVATAGQEVLSWADSALAVRDAVLERAQVMICDLAMDDARVWSELRTALGRERRPRVAVVVESERILDERAVQVDRVLVRPPFSYGAMDEGEPGEAPKGTTWLDELGGWLGGLGPSESGRLEDEARRLLEEGLYRPAVIAAMSAVELALREAVGDVQRPWSSRTSLSQQLPVMGLIEAGYQRGIITEDEARRLRTLQRVRNRAVHGGENVDGRTARGLVDNATRVATRVRVGG